MPTPHGIATPPPAGFDLDTIPKGRNGWPFRYVCDMAACFAAIQKQMDQGDGSGGQKKAADIVLKRSVAAATLSANYKVWQKAGETPGLREKWIRYGRTSEGQWSAFRKAVVK